MDAVIRVRAIGSNAPPCAVGGGTFVEPSRKSVDHQFECGSRSGESLGPIDVYVLPSLSGSLGPPQILSMSTELVIRSAEEADGAALAEIYAPYVRETAISFELEPPTAAVMAQRIATTVDIYPWLVAVQGRDVVAYAYASRHRDRPAYKWTADVTIYVDAKMRRQGVGRALYRVLLDTLRQQGFRSAFAEIVLPNPGSIRLHETAGFELIGVHKNIGFKLGCWHDIGYWRIGLAPPEAEPGDPVPFGTFRLMPQFAALLVLPHST